MRKFQYTDNQLLQRVREVGGKIVDDKILIIGVQNKDDNCNKFDDKFYVFEGTEFILATTGTTNAGRDALLDLKGYTNELGTAVWKTDMFYDDLYSYGKHKNKMEALRQVAPIYFYRDNDGDEKAEEQGQLYHDIIYANFHGVSYDPVSEKIGTNIGGWSYGCQVCNNMTDYREIISLVKKHPLKANYCLLKEF